jgi:hypothetical protein
MGGVSAKEHEHDDDLPIPPFRLSHAAEVPSNPQSPRSRKEV